MIQNLHRLGLFSALLLAVAACSLPSDTQQKPGSGEQKKFTAEDKRVAQALSIGGNKIRVDATPQYRATLCNLALAAISDRLENANLMSIEQLKGFAQAKAIYRDRAVAGLSNKAREEIRNQVESSYPDPNDRVQFAIQCLRDLAGTEIEIENASANR